MSHRPHRLSPLVVAALVAATGAVSVPVAVAQSAGSDVGMVNSAGGGSVDPSSAAAGSGHVGSAGSTESQSLAALGVMPPLGTGSQNTAAEPALPHEDPPVSEVKVVDREDDPLVPDPRFTRLWVSSVAMNRIVPVEVIRSGNQSGPKPRLYLLDGVDAPTPSGWLLPGDIGAKVADRNVDLVMVQGADASLYADWLNDDPVLGRNKWETFMTEELPGALDAELGAATKTGIAGLSMGGGAAAALAVRHPEKYEAVGSLGGCYSAADDIGFLLTKVTVETRGGQLGNLWGERGAPGYAEHDVIRHAEKLRGKTLYFSTATGVPGPHEWAEHNGDMLRFVQGAGLEQAVHACTVKLDRRLDQVGVDARIDYFPTGLHNWGSFGQGVEPMLDTLLPRLGA